MKYCIHVHFTFNNDVIFQMLNWEGQPQVSIFDCCKQSLKGFYIHPSTSLHLNHKHPPHRTTTQRQDSSKILPSLASHTQPPNSALMNLSTTGIHI